MAVSLCSSGLILAQDGQEALLPALQRGAPIKARPLRLGVWAEGRADVQGAEGAMSLGRIRKGVWRMRQMPPPGSPLAEATTAAAAAATAATPRMKARLTPTVTATPSPFFRNKRETAIYIERHTHM